MRTMISRIKRSLTKTVYNNKIEKEDNVNKKEVFAKTQNVEGHVYEHKEHREHREPRFDHENKTQNNQNVYKKSTEFKKGPKTNNRVQDNLKWVQKTVDSSQDKQVENYNS